MEVYVLLGHIEYEDTMLLGVYHTQEDAEFHKEVYINKHKRMTIDVAHIPAHSILHHHITSIPYSREKASDICAVTPNILKNVVYVNATWSSAETTMVERKRL